MTNLRRFGLLCIIGGAFSLSPAHAAGEGGHGAPHAHGLGGDGAANGGFFSLCGN